jgi:hypothetical protein
MIKSHVLYRLSYALTLLLEHDLFGGSVSTPLSKCGAGFLRIMLGPRCVGGGALAVNSAGAANALTA